MPWDCPVQTIIQEKKALFNWIKSEVSMDMANTEIYLKDIKKIIYLRNIQATLGKPKSSNNQPSFFPSKEILF